MTIYFFRLKNLGNKFIKVIFNSPWCKNFVLERNQRSQFRWECDNLKVEFVDHFSENYQIDEEKSNNELMIANFFCGGEVQIASIKETLKMEFPNVLHVNINFRGKRIYLVFESQKDANEAFLSGKRFQLLGRETTLLFGRRYVIQGVPYGDASHFDQKGSYKKLPRRS